jgi:hypothetical protein
LTTRLVKEIGNILTVQSNLTDSASSLPSSLPLSVFILFYFVLLSLLLSSLFVLSLFLSSITLLSFFLFCFIFPIYQKNP